MIYHDNWIYAMMHITSAYDLHNHTYKVLTTSQYLHNYLHNLITVQPPVSTRSSSLATLALHLHHLLYE